MIRHALIALLLVAAPAAASTPVYPHRTIEADGTYTLLHEARVEATVAEVWTAISTVDGWRTWAVPVAWTDPVDPDVIETAYDPAAQPGQPQTIRQRILVRVPSRLLAFRTIKAPAGFTDFDQFSRTAAVFELIAEGPRLTRVRLTGVGYPNTEAGRRLLDFFEHSNALTLERLTRRFEQGALDWPAELRRQAELSSRAR